MGVVFTQGETLTRGSLDIFLTNAQSFPTNAAEIYYAIYYVDPGPPETEVLIGSDQRVPVNPAVGEYYASLMIPTTATVGTYRIRWTFKETISSPYQQVVQEWGVVAAGTVTGVTYTVAEQSMIDKLRILLRDQNPDKFYHFRPPEHEGSIGQYNQVFGQIWEDAEFLEYLERALDWWNMFPPETEDVDTIDKLVSYKPVWRTVVLWGAIAHACFALATNWVAEEFSVTGDTQVRVYLPDGRILDIPIADLYAICHGDD